MPPKDLILGTLGATSFRYADRKILLRTLDRGDGNQLGDAYAFVGTNARGKYGFKGPTLSLA